MTTSPLSRRGFLAASATLSAAALPLTAAGAARHGASIEFELMRVGRTADR